MAGAVALLGTAGFTSCNQKNGPVGPGNYNGETVKAQFAISIPEAGKSNAAGAPDVLRMPADGIQMQASPVFQGMDNIVLIPYNTATSDTKVASGTLRWGSNIEGLIDIPATGEGSISGTANYKVYNNISIPLGTNHFLFYAHGTGAKNAGVAKAQNSYSFLENFQYGRLTPNGLNGEASGITFSPLPIYSTNDDEKGGHLAAYLTTIAKTTYSTKNWAEYDNAHGGNDALSGLCATFKTLRAGSANSVLAYVEDLYNTMENYQESYKKTHESATDGMVAAVMTNILTKTQISSSTAGTGHEGNRTLEWQTSTDFRGYPHNLHLPDGAAALAWQGVDGSHSTDDGFPKFVLSTEYNWTSQTTATFNVAPVASYIYPACLYYYANSALRSSTESQLTKTGVASTPWSTILTWYNEANNTAVSANTRSVAIYDPVQYGVASLKTSVRVKEGVTELKDSRNASIAMANISMTGVLIGGQKAVGFDFTPADNSGALIVYDSLMTDVETGNAYTLSNTKFTQANPTLLLETFANKNVLMAVEFLNNDKDFYGKDGLLIPKGTHFYVVAELAASAATETAFKVFKQDYTTTVQLSLKDLTKAYNVVPDLRTAALELGFSVDLSWQAGHLYEITIGAPED